MSSQSEEIEFSLKLIEAKINDVGITVYQSVDNNDNNDGIDNIATGLADQNVTTSEQLTTLMITT